MFSLFPEKTGKPVCPKMKKRENLLPAALCGLAGSEEKC